MRALNPAITSWRGRRAAITGVSTGIGAAVIAQERRAGPMDALGRIAGATGGQGGSRTAVIGAAREVVRSIERGEFDIHFPRSSSRMFKLLGGLTYRAHFVIARQVTGL